MSSVIRKLKSIGDIDGVVHIVGPDGYVADVDSQGRLLVSFGTSLGDIVSSTTYTGTYSYPALLTTENTIIEVSAPSSGLYEVKGAAIDFSDFSSSNKITLRVYYKIDGSNYRLIDKKVFRVSRNPAGMITELGGLSEDLKITIEPSSAELSIVSVPYRFTAGTITQSQ